MSSNAEYNIEHAFAIIADNFDKLGDAQVIISHMCLCILELAMDKKCKDYIAAGAISVLGRNLRRIEELRYGYKKFYFNSYIQLLITLMSDDYSEYIQAHAIGMLKAHYPALSKSWQKRIKSQFNLVESDDGCFGLVKVKQDLRKTINTVEESNEVVFAIEKRGYMSDSQENELRKKIREKLDPRE